VVARRAWWGEAARTSSATSWLVVALLSLGHLPGSSAGERNADPKSVDPPEIKPADLIAEGRELFNRDWLASSRKPHGGDGLGPVFNGRSCVQCHEQGGVGGAGPLPANVTVLSGRGLWRISDLRHVHPGLVDQPHVVLHKFGASSHYKDLVERDLRLARFTGRRTGPAADSVTLLADQVWPDVIQRQALGMDVVVPVSLVRPRENAFPALTPRRLRANHYLEDEARTSSPASTPFEHRGIVSSERSTTALFGAGLIDAIDDWQIEQVAREQALHKPKIAGLVSRLPHLQIGRFGWHAQVESLREFTVTACAVELGLEVPGHPQAGNPLQPDYRAPGIDLTSQQCDALVAYIEQLPRPIERTSMLPADVAQGRAIFAQIGCADCHRPDMGEATGLYSDLLLHDMGPELQAGAYGAFIPHGPQEAGENQTIGEANVDKYMRFSADRKKDVLWRTAPLWGVASSAPYLHDGRAASLGIAIRLHGGQGRESAEQFASLHREDQHLLLTFLSTLVAPPTADIVPPQEFGGGWGSMSSGRRCCVIGPRFDR
jgi:CxxC motif-containing protein (DUF1111 family)